MKGSVFTLPRRKPLAHDPDRWRAHLEAAEARAERLTDFALEALEHAERVRDPKALQRARQARRRATRATRELERIANNWLAILDGRPEDLVAPRRVLFIPRGMSVQHGGVR